MQDDSAKPPGGNFAIPDLELPDPAVPAAPASGPRPRAAAPPVAPAQDDDFESIAGSVTLGGGRAEDAFGGGFDASHFDSSAVMEDGAAGAGFDEFDASQPVAGLELQSSRPPPPTAAMPSGPSPAASLRPLQSLPVEPAAAAEGSREYGPAPSSIFAAPAYAIRVLLKKRELRQRLPVLDAKLKDGESRRDTFLADLARTRRAAIEGDERYAGPMSRVREAEGQLQHGNQALNQAQNQMTQAKEQFEQQTRGLGEALESANATLRVFGETQAAAETDLKRAEAKQKRLMIEARNAVQAATGGQPGVAIPPEVQTRVSQLQSQAAALEPEVAAARQVVADAADQTQAAKQAQHQAAQAMQGAERQAASQRQQLESQLASHQAAAGDAGSRVTGALADLARALLAARDLPLDDNLSSQVQAAESYVEQCRADHQYVLHALDAADAEAVKRGLLLMVAAAVGVILLLMLLLR